MRRIVVAGFALLAPTACGGETTPTAAPSTPAAPVVHVLGAEVTRTGTLAFTAHNAGAATDVLVAASCTCADATTIDGEIALEPERTASFGAGGPHVVFDALDEDLRPGDFVDITLTFEHAGSTPSKAEIVRD